MTWNDAKQRQNQIMRFVQEYVDSRGHCPTRSEIAAGTSMARNTINRHVNVLIAECKLTEEPGVIRTLRPQPNQEAHFSFQEGELPEDT